MTNRIQNKITASAILLLVALPLLFSVFFVVRQKIIQHEAMENLETASLRTITIPYAELHWLKKGREAVIDGKLFDVKSYVITNEKISLTGLFDEKENELLRHVTAMMQQKSGGNSPFAHLDIKFLFLPVFNEPVSFALENPWRIIVQQFSYYTELTQETYSSSLAPPPKFA